MPDNTNPIKITYTQYHPNGDVKHTITKVNGENHGYEIEYNDANQVIYKCVWHKGKNTGWAIHTSKL